MKWVALSMSVLNSVIEVALPEDYRNSLTKYVFATIEEIGRAENGIVHVDPLSGRYRASKTAAKLLCLDAADGKLESLGQTLDFSNMTAGDTDVAVFYNRDGVLLRLRRLTSLDCETLFFVEDVSARMLNEMAYIAQGRDLHGIFANAPYGIYRSTLDGKPLRANPAMARMNGFETEVELMNALKNTGREWYVDPTQRIKFIEILHKKGRVVDFLSEVKLHNSKSTMWVTESAWLVKDDATGMDIIEGTVIDANLRVMQDKVVRRAAHTDALSGLGNRAAFQNHLKNRIENATADTKFAVLLFDLDRFKDINDVFGHARGDLVILAIAERLKAHAPPDSFVARLGGDEFAIIVKCDIPSTGSGPFAKRMIEEIEKPIHIEGADHHLSSSVGLAVFPTHGTSSSDMVKAADVALYHAKNSGRGRAELFNDELGQKKQAHSLLISDLRGADVRGELELYYQSIVNAITGDVVGVEALMRWNHPTRGLVSPVEFIPAAEDAGLMVSFGNWAIDQACMHAKAIPEHLQVAVNVSAVQFYSADLPKVVAAALARHGMAPHRLELEVTESFILRNEDVTLQVLKELHQLGVRIALDDFGTGYSSLSYLQRFAFDKVKIDKSFVRSLKTNSVNSAIVRAVLSIGRDLGLSVVAEGIETESERNALLLEGCPFFQGFLYSKPKPFSVLTTDLNVDTLRRLALEDAVESVAQTG
jgi:diguanylate cyclase (GGDEF)-like protein